MHTQKHSLTQRTVQAVEDGVTSVVQLGETELGFRVTLFYLKK